MPDSPDQLFADRVTLSENGITLRHFLRLRFPHISQRSIQRRLDQGDILINNHLVKLSQVLLIRGDLVEIRCHLKGFSTNSSYDWSKRAIWNSEDFCAIDKPAGIDSESVAKRFDQSAWMLVHRLDKGTSGVLLLAKNHLMASFGRRIFQKRAVAKHYLALVCNSACPKMTIKARLRPKFKLKGKTLWEAFSSPNRASKEQSLSATTHFECLSQGVNTSLLYCRPITGRTHQIRLHAAHMGHAILGDDEYNRVTSHRCPRLMLHARRLVIPELKLDVLSDIPADFSCALKRYDLLIDFQKLTDLENCYGALSHK